MEEELETTLGPTMSETTNSNRAMRESFSEVISIPSSASIFSISSGELAQPISLLSSCSSDPSTAREESENRTLSWGRVPFPGHTEVISDYGCLFEYFCSSV